MARIVVTGGAGFLGSHLCHRLIERGDEVVCLDNLITGSIRNIEDLFGHERFTYVDLDVSTYVHVPPAEREDRVLRGGELPGEEAAQE